MVKACNPARFGRIGVLIAAASAFAGAGSALARDAAASPSTAAADADADWSDGNDNPGSGVTVGRALDLVGRPVDIVASTRRRDALENARRKGASGFVGAGVLPAGMPVSASYISSGFGQRVHPLLGIIRGHSGIDLPAPWGSPIRATSDGVVDSAGWRGGYGQAVEIDHGKGVQSRYAHMSRIAVYPGEAVKRGEVIGYVGSTGLSTGPHLHYEIRINGAAVNPYGSLRGR